MSTTTHRGLFIVFEGGEGSGKSTQAAMLADALENHNIRTHLTREPGNTCLGKKLRGILLDDPETITPKAEALLFAADRAEHVETVIKPNLHLGRVVVCDRYIASTIAYQVHANGLPETPVRAMSDWASGELYPDITFYLDVNPKVGLQRSRKVETNRFEDKDLFYHEKVRGGYLKQKGDSWVVIDAEDTIANIHDKILDHVLHVWTVLERFRNGIQTVEEVRQYSGFEDRMEVYTNFPGKSTEEDTTTHCPECGILLVLKQHYQPHCPNMHGWLDESNIWHPPFNMRRDNPSACEQRGLCDNPAHAHTIAEDLSDMAQYGLRPEPVIGKSTATAPQVVRINSAY